MVQPHSAEDSWRKSARCEAQNCVEVARRGDGMAIRNSTLPERHLAFAGRTWQTFVDGVRAGQFNVR
jgi:hypothetical protein